MSNPGVRGVFGVVCLVVVTAALAGCSSKKTTKLDYNLGDKVVVGPLTYNVIETKWQSQLGSFPTARMAQHQFLLVHLTATNGGGAEVTLPMFSIQSATGDSYNEISDGAGVDGWLGVIRRVPAADTEQGWVLFDVPLNGYKMRLTAGVSSQESDDGDEKAAFVALPLQMQSGKTPQNGPGVPALLVPRI